MGHWTVYVDARDKVGQPLVLKIQLHHGDVDRIDVLSVQEALEEINENKKEAVE